MHFVIANLFRFFFQTKDFQFTFKNMFHMNKLALNIAASGEPSSMKGGFPVAISTMVQPSDQISAGAPYPRWPLSITSGAIYCSVPVNVSVLKHKPASRFDVPKSDILTTPLNEAFPFKNQSNDES